MRKITAKATEAFLNYAEFRLDNTEVVLEPDAAGSIAVLLLHNNEIAKLWPDGVLEVTLAGWPTPTTRERLNALPSVIVTQKAGVQYLNGVEWDGDWQIVGSNYAIAQRGDEWHVYYPSTMRLPPMVFDTEASARVFFEVQRANAT